MAEARKETDDLESYRSLMEPPKKFTEGFTGRTVIGAFFVGFIMMPGAIYMGLIAGVSLGAAAEWVTIILFSELARRSFSALTRQEIYLIYYIAGGLAGVVGGTMLAGGPFGQLVWHQYIVQSQAAAGFGITEHIPSWVAPAAGSEAITGRSFLHKAWIPPIAVLVASQVLSRVEWFTLGYVLFRVTSDVERLPFPLAPVAAQGATALAEGDDEQDSWRWRVFSIGMGIGLLFGSIYVGLPALTGLIASDPISLLPIPWIDLTPTTESFLPAAPMGIGTDLGLVLLGTVLPFWVVVGSFTAAMVHALGSPILYHLGALPHWRPGMDTILTNFANDVDVWMSVYIGAGAAVGLIGIVHAVRSLAASRKKGERGRLQDTPEGRGDFPLWLAIGGYALSTLAMIGLCVLLLEDDDFPLVFLLLFGFVLTPMLSYVNARMAGLTGQTVSFPMIREGAFILSGYKGIDIWFAPIPYADHGRRAQLFREVELTGTRFSSILKAELLLLPLSIVCGFVFWSLIWQMGPIPSPAFQYAQTYWHLIALRQCLWYSATLGGETLFDQAIKAWWIVGGFAFAGGAFGILSLLRLPISLIYGFVRGLSGLPHMLIPEMVGALIARYSLEKKFGVQRWRQYAPVLLAGYACGMGLIGMSAVAIALISKSVTQLQY
ncbi:MAG TPA: peptide transporter [Candidatus Latescibacteria bacterium]|nr:peptide transporter [Candidatus Handelsmanbacteria bacterium]HIL10997.1 peptide transporter [Candidatus Latescibacterota bacterium]